MVLRFMIKYSSQSYRRIVEDLSNTVPRFFEVRKNQRTSVSEIVQNVGNAIRRIVFTDLECFMFQFGVFRFGTADNEVSEADMVIIVAVLVNRQLLKLVLS